MALLEHGKPYLQPKGKRAHYPHRLDGHDTDIGWCGRPLTTLEWQPRQTELLANTDLCANCKKLETKWLGDEKEQQWQN